MISKLFIIEVRPTKKQARQTSLETHHTNPPFHYASENRTQKNIKINYAEFGGRLNTLR